jgi:hypothetical protein
MGNPTCIFVTGNGPLRKMQRPEAQRAELVRALLGTSK